MLPTLIISSNDQTTEIADPFAAGRLVATAVSTYILTCVQLIGEPLQRNCNVRCACSKSHFDTVSTASTLLLYACHNFLSDCLQPWQQPENNCFYLAPLGALRYCPSRPTQHRDCLYSRRGRNNSSPLEVLWDTPQSPAWTYATPEANIPGNRASFQIAGRICLICRLWDIAKRTGKLGDTAQANPFYAGMISCCCGRHAQLCAAAW